MDGPFINIHLPDTRDTAIQKIWVFQKQAAINNENTWKFGDAGFCVIFWCRVETDHPISLSRHNGVVSVWRRVFLLFPIISFASISRKTSLNLDVHMVPQTGARICTKRKRIEKKFITILLTAFSFESCSVLRSTIFEQKHSAASPIREISQTNYWKISTTAHALISLRKLLRFPCAEAGVQV